FESLPRRIDNHHVGAAKEFSVLARGPFNDLNVLWLTESSQAQAEPRERRTADLVHLQRSQRARPMHGEPDAPDARVVFDDPRAARNPLDDPLNSALMERGVGLPERSGREKILGPEQI